MCLTACQARTSAISPRCVPLDPMHILAHSTKSKGFSSNLQSPRHLHTAMCPTAHGSSLTSHARPVVLKCHQATFRWSLWSTWLFKGLALIIPYCSYFSSIKAGTATANDHQCRHTTATTTADDTTTITTTVLGRQNSLTSQRHEILNAIVESYPYPSFFVLGSSMFFQLRGEGALFTVFRSTPFSRA